MQTPTNRRPSVPSACRRRRRTVENRSGAALKKVRRVEEGQPIRVSGNPPQLPGPCTLTSADRRHWEGLKGPNKIGNFGNEVEMEGLRPQGSGLPLVGVRVVP